MLEGAQAFPTRTGGPGDQRQRIGPPDQGRSAGEDAFFLSESGTITLADAGNGYFQATVYANMTLGVNGEDGGGNLTLSGGGYATATGLLDGFDLDQFNQSALGDLFNIELSTPSSYSLDANGTNILPTTNSNTTQTTQAGTVTTTEADAFTYPTANDSFDVDVQGNADGSRQISWNDMTFGSYTGAITGTDTDSTDPTTAPATNDSFSDTISNGSYTVSDYETGTLDTSGNFTPTSFSINQTTSEVDTDTLTGTTTAPEPGGSESDTFTDNDTMHDQQHLVASGTADNWTASLNETDHGAFTEQDDGSESSSQTTNGETDTNSDQFHANDGGTETETLHLAGAGTATTFTASSISDTIGDTDHYTDSDGGTSGDASTGETDSDNYTSSDTGTAAEALTVSGDANNLTAGYTENAQDGFTDSDTINDNWNEPDSAGTGADSGNDQSTDGDNGSETVNLSANATLPNWQTTSTTVPTWQVTSVGADVAGSASVQSGDGGLDTDAVGPDAQADQFTDTATGTDGFHAHLAGDGTVATLQQAATLGLTTHSEDDTAIRWADPDTLDSETAIDAGTEQVDDIADSTPTMTVSQQSTLAADGTPTLIGCQVDVASTSTDQEAIDGSDDDAATKADDRATVDDAGRQTQTDHMHVDTAEDGTATITADQTNIVGTMALGDTETDTDTINPRDEDTDTDTDSLDATVNGDLHQSATATAADQVEAAPATGALDVDTTGAVVNTDVQTFHADHGAEPGDVAPYPVPSGDFSVAAELYQPEDVTLPDPLPAAGPADVTETTTASVTLTDLNQQLINAGYGWGLGFVDESASITTATSYTGEYTGTLLFAGGTGNGAGTTTDTVTISVAGPPGGLIGTVTTVHDQTEQADAVLEGGETDDGSADGDGDPGDGIIDPSYTGTAHVDGDSGWSESESGFFTPGGSITLTRDSRQEWGSDNLTFHIEAPGLTEDYEKHESHSFADDGTAIVGILLGTDSQTLTFHVVTTGGGVIVDATDGYLGTGTYQPDGSGGVVRNVARSDHYYGTTTDLTTGQQTPFTSTTGAINSVDEAQWWRARNPFTSAPDFNPNSMGGTTTFIGGVAPFYGPLRNGLNDLQNGRVASGVKNLGLAALDFSLIRSAFQLATKGVAWASGKAAGQAGSKLAAEAAASTTEELTAAAGRAARKVGSGKGGAYGSRVHSAFRAEVEGLGRGLGTEASFLNGRAVRYGTAGSVRLDVVEYGLDGTIKAVYDLKTGTASLLSQRIQQILSHLPGGGVGVPVIEIRP